MTIKRKFIYTLVLTVLFVLATTAGAQAQNHHRAKPRVQRATVLITEKGYSPGSIKLRRGVPARVTFMRQTDRTCGTEIVIPAYGINRPLPLNRRVVIAFTPRRTGEIGFACGMNMMHGKMVVI